MKNPIGVVHSNPFKNSNHILFLLITSKTIKPIKGNTKKLTPFVVKTANAETGNINEKSEDSNLENPEILKMEIKIYAQKKLIKLKIVIIIFDSSYYPRMIYIKPVLTLIFSKKNSIQCFCFN